MVKLPPARLIVESISQNWTFCNLSRPDRIDWPFSRPKLEDLCQKVKYRLSEEQKPLVDLSLAAHFLLSSAEKTDFFSRQEFVYSLDADLLPKGIFHENRNWCLMPVVVVSPEKKADIYYFMAGTRTDPSCANWPEWLTDHLDPSSREAISDAFQSAQELSRVSSNLFTFPLMPPDTSWNIQGRSLGLPLALAALSVLTGEALAPDILATGDLDRNHPDFPVEAVADIPAKIEAARAKEYRLMLVPRDTPSAVDESSCLIIRQARDLKEAWLWARLYAPGREKDLGLLHCMQSDARLLVDNCLNIDRELLAWLISPEKKRHLSEAVLGDSDCIKTLVRKLEDCLSHAGRDLIRAASLEKLISDDFSWKSLEKNSILLAFKWATLCLKRANHCGENEKTAFWSQTANKLRPKVVSGYPSEYSEFINNLLVSRHNTYTFSTDIPSWFVDAIEDEKRCKRGISHVLGCMYGTLAQNFAFCGSEHLEKTEQYVKLAQAEFSSGSAPEYYKDWIREFSYLVYAFLDSGDHLKARQVLDRYLQINCLSETKPWNELNPYEQKALVRYLADTVRDTDDQVEKELAVKLIQELEEKVFEASHPFQLICYNLGRIALGLNYSARAARHYLEKSLRLCELNDETVRVMALLPLSGLCHAGLITPLHEKSVESIMELILSSRFLNKTHFEPLMKGEIFSVLELVWKNPARFFPFMYR